MPLPMASNCSPSILFLPWVSCVFCLANFFSHLSITSLYWFLLGLRGFGRTWASEGLIQTSHVCFIICMDRDGC